MTSIKQGSFEITKFCLESSFALRSLIVQSSMHSSATRQPLTKTCLYVSTIFQCAKERLKLIVYLFEGILEELLFADNSTQVSQAMSEHGDRSCRLGQPTCCMEFMCLKLIPSTWTSILGTRSCFHTLPSFLNRPDKNFFKGLKLLISGRWQMMERLFTNKWYNRTHNELPNLPNKTNLPSNDTIPFNFPLPDNALVKITFSLNNNNLLIQISVKES